MAGWKYEKNGVLVAVPTGHKKAGWVKEFVNYRPLMMKGGK